ncbi:histidine phosphatase family protein [Aquamicrobium sp. LC103]|uniref:histidine phosphatase family protein n=1 Tax=Aquamicrobium sp. LC103 TaxID=1120658 RepID=UPI00063EB4A7|nr:histidine phosphatase family protein [Aquamicrobium sp. LC103]TKT81127.1 histidine phosphatase family protein [Aquamicrobium sp. LC103]
MDFICYFVRHGQTDWNAEYRLQGQADTDINAVGRAQADGNGRRLAGLIGTPENFRFVASPLRRTRETMERIRGAMGLPPEGYETDDRLIEVHFGDWQGHTFDELELVDPGCTARRDADKWHFLPPGEHAESYEMLAARVRSFVEEIAGPTVCVTHGGVIRSIFRLTGSLGPEECSALTIPQDRILRMSDGRLEWI